MSTESHVIKNDFKAEEPQPPRDPRLSGGKGLTMLQRMPAYINQGKTRAMNHSDSPPESDSNRGSSGSGSFNQGYLNNTSLFSSTVLHPGISTDCNSKPHLVVADDDSVNKKKRGRRKLEDDQYYAISNDKI
jgi:hypothetical protein